MINYLTVGPSSERISEEYLALNSCGIEWLSDIDRGSMRKNGRSDYHILYIEKGVCYLELDNGVAPIESGNIIFFRPGEPQCYHFLADDKSISHYIHFTGKGCENLLEKLGIRDIKVFDMGVSATYEELSAKMVREYTMKRQHWENICVGCLYELLSLIARKYSYRRDSISAESEHRIGAACRKIYDNIASPPRLSELASYCNLSESRFSHLFSEVVGKPPKDFILSLRIERACELLENARISVREVAESTGFADQSYFSRVFKNRVGCSPIEYKKNLHI